MLIGPLNDKECLGLLHDDVQQLIASPSVRAGARRYGDVLTLTETLRHRPQRDDIGDPEDGPRLPCQVSQRVRHNAFDPNCFERTADYLTYAEILDPHTERTSATVIVDGKWHTFPVEIRNGLPRIVVLDPYSAPPLNTMAAAAYQARNVAVGARGVLIPWYLEVARNACIDEDTEPRFDQALYGMRLACITGEPIPEPYRGDLDHVLGLASQDAALWGARGRKAAERVHSSVRNFSLDLAGGKVAGLLQDLARAGQKLAPDALRLALLAQYGPAATLALEGVQLVMKPGPEAPAEPVVTADDGHGMQVDRGALAPLPGQRPRTALDAARRMSFAFRTT